MTALTILGRLDPPIAPWAIVPFLESYLVVADALAEHGIRPDFNEKEFVSAAMKLGEEYRLMGKVSADSVSTVMFRQALALAAQPGTARARPERPRRPGREFADEIRRVIDGRRRLGRPDRSRPW